MVEEFKSNRRLNQSTGYAQYHTEKLEQPVEKPEQTGIFGGLSKLF